MSVAHPGFKSQSRRYFKGLQTMKVLKMLSGIYVTNLNEHLDFYETLLDSKVEYFKYMKLDLN